MDNSIKAIGKRMATQDNRCSQNVLFAVEEDVEVPAYHRTYAESRRQEEVDSSLLCEECLEMYENDHDLPEACDDCDEDAFVYFNTERRLNLQAGVFFTEQACLDHIDMNGYHYTNPRCYGISAWRNPEMVAVMNFIMESAGVKIPNHYDKK